MSNAETNFPTGSPQDIARVLTQALPYIQRFAGKICIVKYGGNAMIDENLQNSFARDIVLMKLVGMHPVVVHGGGPQIGEFLNKLDIKTEFIDGIRVTPPAAMEVVEMILGGKINKRIVQLIQSHGGLAMGLTGVDGNCINARKITHNNIDYGQVGEVIGINAEIIINLIKNDIVPVIAPIGSSTDGQTFNINADTVASQIAIALKAERLVLLTNTAGVLDQTGELIPLLGAAQVTALINDGTISGGMLPKIRCGLESIRNGVDAVQIIDGRMPHAILLELFTKNGIGTKISV